MLVWRQAGHGWCAGFCIVIHGLGTSSLPAPSSLGPPLAVCTCRPRCFQTAVTSEKRMTEQKWRPCQDSTSGKPQQTSTCGYQCGTWWPLFARKTGRIAFKLGTLLFPPEWGFTLKEKGETRYWAINDQKWCAPVVSAFLKDAWSQALYSQYCKSTCEYMRTPLQEMPIGPFQPSHFVCQTFLVLINSQHLFQR